MKILSLMVALFLCATMTYAQNSDPNVIKEWNMIGESKNHVDVSYRIVKCDNTVQIHLMIFNENPTDQAVEFDVTVNGATEEQTFVKNVKYAAAKAAIVKANCENDEALKVLKITVPADYDASKLTLKVNFKY